MISQRWLAAIMFTDIVGFSTLTQENEALALELLNEHFTLLRPIIPEYDGDEIKTMGDSFLVEFASPLQAVKCAIEFQRALRKRNLDASPARQIQIRIGIHVGDVEHVDGDVIGDGVNIASRIEPLAEPGGIALTRQVYDHVHNKIDFELKSLGAPQLKNITTIVEIYKVDLKWESTSSAELVRTKAQRRDNLLKIGSVVAVAVIAIAAAFTIWQSMPNETFAELEPGEITSIAVLPFTDLSENEDQEYFSDGLAEELRNALVKIPDLRVPSFTSSSAENLAGRSLKDIAKDLGVEAVLEGSVRKSGDQLRITAKFILASDDTHLWSESFDRQMGNIFEIQEEIAQAIVQKLGYSALRDRIVETGTENTEAYNFYLQGRFQWNKRTEEGFERAIAYFEEAIELDPNYAQAYVGLSDTYALSADYGFMLPEEGNKLGEELAEMALEIDSDNAEAYTSLANIQLNHYRNFEKAESFFLKSIALNPDYATAHHWYRILLELQGRYDEALKHIAVAHQLDPLSTIILMNYAMDLGYQQQFDEAFGAIEKIFEINPEFPNGYAVMAYTYREQGNWAMVEESLRRGVEVAPESAFLHRIYGETYSFQGKFDLADSELLRSIELAPNSIIPRVSRGQNFLFAGRYDDALTQLKETMQLEKTHWFTLRTLAWAYFYAGEFDETLELVDEATKYFDDSDTVSHIYFETIRGSVYAILGDRENVDRSIEQLMQYEHFKFRGNPYGLSRPYALAHIYAALGDTENTFKWLQEAVDIAPQVTLKVNPIFEPYRDDARFQELLRKIGFIE